MKLTTKQIIIGTLLFGWFAIPVMLLALICKVCYIAFKTVWDRVE